jgi:hypothetical protein
MKRMSIVLSALSTALFIVIAPFAQAQQTSLLFDFTLSKTMFPSSVFDERDVANFVRTDGGITLPSDEAHRSTFRVARIDTRLPDATPFLTFSARLSVRNADANNIRVYVRPAVINGTNMNINNQAETTDGEPWKALGFDSHSEDGDGLQATGAESNMIITQLAFLPEGTSAVEFKIELQRSSQNLTPCLRDCRVFFFNPGRTIQSNQQSQMGVLGEKVSADKAEIQGNTYPRPAFVSRTEWGCPWGQGSGPNTLTATLPTHLIVHHSFSPGNDVTDWQAAIRGVWNYHVNSNGWSDIGYNWLIDPSGNIYQGRAWVGESDNTQGAHFCGFNRSTMGVCMLGDFNNTMPSSAALKSLVRLLAYRTSASALNVLGTAYHDNSQRTLSIVSGHRDGCSTDCPGNAFYPTLPTLRSRVWALLNPPTIQTPAAIVRTPSSVEFAARIVPNGSEIIVFLEWDAAPSVPSVLRNRQRVRTFSATDTASPVRITLTDFAPNASVVYRFVAENSDTLAVSEQQTVRLTQTGIRQHSSAVVSSVHSLHIAPNPTSSESVFSYRLETASFVRLTLVGSHGRAMRELLAAQQAEGMQTCTIDCSMLGSGVYYVYCETGEGRYIHPIVVVR